MLIYGSLRFLLSLCGGVGVDQSFRVQPNYSVEVVLWLCCVIVGIVTT